MKTNEDISPDAQPFESAMRNLPNLTPEHVRASLAWSCDTVDMAKRILLQCRVRQFTAADVVALTRIIHERDLVEYQRQNAGVDE